MNVSNWDFDFHNYEEQYEQNNKVSNISINKTKNAMNELIFEMKIKHHWFFSVKEFITHLKKRICLAAEKCLIDFG